MEGRQLHIAWLNKPAAQLTWESWTVPAIALAENGSLPAAGEGEQVVQGPGWQWADSSQQQEIQTTLAIEKPGAVHHLEQIVADAVEAGFEVTFDL